MTTRAVHPAEGVIVITGGAGFIGSNLAHDLLQRGWQVTLLDNLSRTGVERNVRWLCQTHGERVQLERVDIRDAQGVRRGLESAARRGGGKLACVFHFAAQVAVTSSLLDPLYDFEVNAHGTLNVLRAICGPDALWASPPPLIYTSTNKVYGSLNGLATKRAGNRYEPLDVAVAARGIDEQRPLDFQSPYGCSKGSADQYVLDFSRSFGLPATVFRMSCIYGPHQFGTEDQGWIAHFLIRALKGVPITIYGDGCQVRDALYIDDLVRAFRLAFGALQQECSGPPHGCLAANVHPSQIAALLPTDDVGVLPVADQAPDGVGVPLVGVRPAPLPVTGQAFNIGGGPGRSLSLLELTEMIGALPDIGALGGGPSPERRPLQVQVGGWRTGDQRYYVSDTGKFMRATGWTPWVSLPDGLARLHAWLAEHAGAHSPAPLHAAAPEPVGARGSVSDGAPSTSRTSIPSAAARRAPPPNAVVASAHGDTPSPAPLTVGTPGGPEGVGWHATLPSRAEDVAV
jgi:CDP-paratose 2-epimerase